VPGVLEFDGLSRRFGPVTALDDLSFSVPSGEVVGFLGPNGAGKTTTMRAIFGLTDLDAGSVRWNGAPVGASQRRRFGYMPEEPRQPDLALPARPGWLLPTTTGSQGGCVIDPRISQESHMFAVADFREQQVHGVPGSAVDGRSKGRRDAALVSAAPPIDIPERPLAWAERAEPVDHIK